MSKIDPQTRGQNEDLFFIKSCKDTYLYNHGDKNLVNPDFLAVAPGTTSKKRFKELKSSMGYGHKFKTSTYCRYLAHSNIWSKRSVKILSSQGKLYLDIEASGLSIRTDFDGMVKFLFSVVSNKYTFSKYTANYKNIERAESAALKLMKLDLNSAMMGSLSQRHFYKYMCSVSDYPDFYWGSAAMLDLLSSLRNNCGHLSKRNIVKLISAGRLNLEMKDVKLNKNHVAMKLKRVEVHIIKDMKIIQFKGDSFCYCFGPNAMEALEDRLVFFTNVVETIMSYDMIKSNTSVDLLADFELIIQWMVKQTNHKVVAKHMKSSLAIIQNNFMGEHEAIDMGAEGRSNTLKDNCVKEGILGKMFYDLFDDLSSDWYTRMELSYLFHLMPSPDCDYDSLFDELFRKTSESNPVNDKEFNNLVLLYNTDCIVKALGMYGEKVLGYITNKSRKKLKSQEWVISCLNGQLMYPLEEEWHLYNLGRFYPRSNHHLTWQTKDTTNGRIIMDVDHYLVHRFKDKKWSKKCGNELLYALFYGSKLSFNYDPEELDKLMMSGKFAGQCVAIDQMEKTINELNKCCIPIEFRKTKDKTITITCSSDVKGWSPNVNRKYTDMVQGRSDGQDTILHSGILSRVIQRLKETNVLKTNESAYGMFLIDDSVLNVTLDADRDSGDLTMTAKEVYRVLKKVYKDLGMIIEDSKTIYSTHKFIFLNRFYSSGVEINTSLKVIGSMSRNRTSILPTLSDHCESFFSVAKSAVSRGADPHLDFFLASRKVLEMLYELNKDFKKLATVPLWFLLRSPKSLGGLGCPTFISFCGVTPINLFDHLASAAMYLAVQENKLNPTAKVYKCFSNLVNSIFNHKEAKQNTSDVRNLENGFASASSRVFENKVKEILKDIKPPHEDLKMFWDLNAEQLPEAVEELLTCSVVDLSIIEEMLNNLPSVLGASLVSKFEKGQIMKCMMYGVITSLKKTIRKLDLASVENFLVMISKNNDNLIPEFGDCVTGFSFSFVCREMSLSLKSLSSTNHTVPDPFHVVTRTWKEQNTLIRVNCHSCCNMVDGTTDLIHGLTERGRCLSIATPSIKYNSEGHTWSDDELTNSFVSSISLSNFLIKSGAEGEEIMDSITKAWGSSKSIKSVDYPGINTECVSTKHLGGSGSNKFHTIMPCPSTSSCISVTADNLAKLIVQRNFHVDYLSIVYAAHTRALVEYKMLDHAMPTLCYSIINHAIIPSDQVIYKCYSENLNTMKPSDLKITKLWNAITKAAQDINDVSTINPLQFDQFDRNNGIGVIKRRKSMKSMKSMLMLTPIDIIKCHMTSCFVNHRHEIGTDTTESAVNDLIFEASFILHYVINNVRKTLIEMYSPWLLVASALSILLRINRDVCDKCLRKAALDFCLSDVFSWNGFKKSWWIINSLSDYWCHKRDRYSINKIKAIYVNRGVESYAVPLANDNDEGDARVSSEDFSEDISDWSPLCER